METQIKKLVGTYQFKSPYHNDQRLLPFQVLGNSYDKEYPIKAETVEYRGWDEKKRSGNYKIEVIQDFIESGFLVKVKETNLNPLFIDQIANFAHLVDIAPQSKTDFLENIKKTYSTDNPKTELFYLSVERSEFETIRLTKNRNSILFNY